MFVGFFCACLYFTCQSFSCDFFVPRVDPCTCTSGKVRNYVCRRRYIVARCIGTWLSCTFMKRLNGYQNFNLGMKRLNGYQNFNLGMPLAITITCTPTCFLPMRTRDVDELARGESPGAIPSFSQAQVHNIIIIMYMYRTNSHL